MNRETPYPAIVIYGAFVATVWSILWPEVENDETGVTGHLPEKAICFQILLLDVSSTINCVTQAPFGLHSPSKNSIMVFKTYQNHIM